MELIGKIKAKIHAHTFDGVPKDTEVVIFIPGVKKPLKAMLSDIEIEGAAQTVIEELQPMKWHTGNGTITFPAGVTLTSGLISFDHGGGWFAPAKPSVSGDETMATLKAAIPNLADIKTDCPQCVFNGATSWSNGISWCSGATPLLDVIVHLNDYHRWSRENIANWLETKDWDLQFVTPEGETA